MTICLLLPGEYPFPAGTLLHHRTCRRILYCNPMFVEVQWLRQEELLGPNIRFGTRTYLKAYRDMWKPLAKAFPWSAR